MILEKTIIMNEKDKLILIDKIECDMDKICDQYVAEEISKKKANKLLMDCINFADSEGACNKKDILKSIKYRIDNRTMIEYFVYIKQQTTREAENMKLVVSLIREQYPKKVIAYENFGNLDKGRPRITNNWEKNKPDYRISIGGATNYVDMKEMNRFPYFFKIGDLKMYKNYNSDICVRHDGVFLWYGGKAIIYLIEKCPRGREYKNKSTVKITENILAYLKKEKLVKIIEIK